MGSRSIGTRKGIPTVRRTPATIGTPLNEAPVGCPEVIQIEGVNTGGLGPGHDVSLTLAGGSPQLAVAGRVLEDWVANVDMETLRRCLSMGEKYYGQVASANTERFEATLGRV